MKKHEEQVWKRGKIIGRGGFGTVSLAITHHHYLPSLIAVKSAELLRSISLIKEREILSYFKACPYIIRCYGHDFTFENGYPFFNLLLEYASGGSLHDRIKRSKNCNGLPESQVRLYTRSILRGLKKIHQHGYVHCDIKPQNILIVSSSSNSKNPEFEKVKIADFGLAKRVGEQNKKDTIRLRGTPLYMAPESVTHNEYEPHSDVWALGCVVVEMLTGEQAWNCPPDTDLCTLLGRIGYSRELPYIAREISKEGRDFLNKCFVRDTVLRWTPYMLLQHPFVSIDDIVVGEAEKDLTEKATIGLVPSPMIIPLVLPPVKSPVSPCLICKKRQRINDEAQEVKRRPSVDGTSSTANVPRVLQRYWCTKKFAEAEQSNDSIYLEGQKQKRIMDNEVEEVTTLPSIGGTSNTANVPHVPRDFQREQLNDFTSLEVEKRRRIMDNKVEEVKRLPSIWSTSNPTDVPHDLQRNWCNERLAGAKQWNDAIHFEGGRGERVMDEVIELQEEASTSTSTMNDEPPNLQLYWCTGRFSAAFQSGDDDIPF